MAKFSILPFLLILAISLPLILAVSGAIPTEVDCLQRPDDAQSDGDLLVGGSMPSSDEDDTDEQLDAEGFLEDDEDENEASYIVMPTDDDYVNDDEDDTTESSSSSSSDDGDQSYPDVDESDFDSDEEVEDIGDQGKLGVSVEKVVTAAFFNSIKKNTGSGCKGKKFYTRAAFLKATKSYPEFGKQKTDAATKREIAAFFAHVTHETGSLCYVEEIKKATYCEPKATQWPCAAGKQYFGRGPLQLTWNYNYGPCGKANKFDGLKKPETVSNNPVMTWKASLWFWKKNVRSKLKDGFAATIRAINGGECGGGNRPAVASRVKFYKAYCKRFKVKPGSNLFC